VCVNCISNSEAYVAQAALVVAVFKQPVHRVLAEVGLVAPPDPVKQEVRTVAFLRALDLDPVEILGEAAVTRAECWRPQLRPTFARSRLPIGAHSFAATQ
jgi:hypothetical protein